MVLKLAVIVSDSRSLIPSTGAVVQWLVLPDTACATTVANKCPMGKKRSGLIKKFAIVFTAVPAIASIHSKCEGV